MTTTNSIGTSTLSETWRIEYVMNVLNVAPRTALVAEKVCKVDRSESYYLANPYMTNLTATLGTLDGTYTPGNTTITDETLTVNNQVDSSTQLLEFQQTLSRVDLFTAFVENMKNAVADKIDQYVLNQILDDATSTYNTPSGGFTADNVPSIISDLCGKVAGFRGIGEGYFLVIENTELPGFIKAGMTNGFSFADSTLNNGFGGSFGGVEVYVVRTGTFTTGTLGTLTAANLNHRLFGIKGVATYAAPRGIQYHELKVSGQTGKEVACWANIGAKCWTPQAGLLVDITIV